MPYPVRQFLPDRIYFLTNRCLDSRFLLLPDRVVNDIIGEWLVRAAHRFNVEIFAFIWLSSHYHVVCRSPDGNLDEFVGYLQTYVARFVNVRRGRSGTVFPRRYSAEPILDHKKLIDRIVYVLTNPSKDGLVDRIEHWPGLSSAPESLENEKRSFRIFRRTEWHDAGCPADREPFIEHLELEIAPPPCWKDLDPEERAARMKKAIRSKEAEYRKDRRASGRSVLGREGVLQAKHTDRPKKAKRSPRPLCHTSSTELWKQFREEWNLFLHAYRAASARYRDGDYEVEFPPGSFPPWVRPRRAA